ncbi:MAG TPA: hypothetical protein DHV36_24265, partial [Desulfobacteraceae bacterium]|nr:hypothetical protein [Desulfobacteraceae bacterium]
MIRNIIFVYLAWCLASFGIYLSGYLVPAQGGLYLPLVLLSMAAALFAALGLLRFYAKRVEPAIGDRHLFRIFLLAITLAVFFSVYAFEAVTGLTYDMLAVIATANLLFFASILGFWMVFPLKRPAEIMPLCLVAALADMISVTAGPTKEFSDSLAAYYTGGEVGLPPFVDFLLVKIAIPGQLMPVFGISDWVIVVFLSAAAWKFGMDDALVRPARQSAAGNWRFWLTFPVSCAGLILALLLAKVSGAFIPALPFVAIVFLAVMMHRYP